MFIWLRMSRGLMAAVAILSTLSAGPAVAQDRNEEALILVSSAMDAYSNLEMDRAQELLDEALALEDELEPSTRAKIYSSLGVLWISGFSDNTAGQTHFTKAACIDENAKVDPLFSTPEIDLMFSQARESITPEKCEELGVPLASAPPPIEPCGTFEPPEMQRKSHEIPFFLRVAPAVKYQLDRVVLNYSYDSSKYQEVELTPKSGNGYGVMLECFAHDIRSANPNLVTYYIQGIAADGTVICGHGTDEYPFNMDMVEGVDPLPPVGGMSPKECVQCAPGDTVCEKKQEAAARGDAKDGESCTADADCVMGLICDPEMFVCATEVIKKEEPEDGAGPRRFYVNLTGGSGFGYMKKDIKVTKAAFPPDNYDPEGRASYDPRDEIMGETIEEPTGQIKTLDRSPKGTGWAGVPIRLALGFHINERLSLEVSGRFDAYIVTNSTPKSCFDAAGGDLALMRNNISNGCTLGLDPTFDDSNYDDEDLAEMGKIAMAMQDAGGGESKVINEKEYQIAWLVNARARFRYLTIGKLVASVFGGIGYGTIQYRVSGTQGDESYFPMPGMIDIEIGTGLAYYFNRHVGVVFDVPIDFIVGDGFAVNFDFNLGIGVGF